MTSRKAWYEAIRKKYPHHPAFSAPDVEQDSRNASVAEEGPAGHDGRCNITVTSYLKRDRDPDGTSFKYCLDSIVDAKILGGDTSAHIEEIRHRQVKIGRTEEERTEILIAEVRK